jgi:hypothetical protein
LLLSTALLGGGRFVKRFVEVYCKCLLLVIDIQSLVLWWENSGRRERREILDVDVEVEEGDTVKGEW